MRETDETCNRLINEFAESYMEKLFYFCLKKTGSNVEAEDLTQAIDDFTELGDRYGIRFVLSISRDPHTLPANAADKIMIGL